MNLGINLPGPFHASVRVRDGISGGSAVFGLVIAAVYLMAVFWYITALIVVIVVVVRWRLQVQRSKQLIAGKRYREPGYKAPMYPEIDRFKE